MIKIVKQYCKHCEHTKLYKFGNMSEGNVVLSGDSDHDKINYQIDGFLKAYKEMNIEFEFIIGDDNICDKCKCKNQDQNICKHLNTEPTHPYGWMVCSDCGKLLS